MSFIGTFKKAKSKISTWREEREQKNYDDLKTKQKLSKAYNKRSSEITAMQKDVDEANKNKFDNSFWGKSIKGMKKLDRSVNKDYYAKQNKKGKKAKKPKIKRESYDKNYNDDPWA